MKQTRRNAIKTGIALSAGAIAGCLGGGGSAGETVSSLPSPSLGSSDAPVTVEGFEDFACSHCRRFALQDLARLVQEYVQSGDVRYEHHDFPIPVDPKWSWKAASGARAVQDTVGDEAFFQFVVGLYQNMNAYSFELLGTLGEDVGADPEVVRQAARNETYKPVLEADFSHGRDLGVRGTPTVVVNGSKAKNYRFETVSTLVEAELA